MDAAFLFIHTAADIPVKRRLEEATGRGPISTKILLRKDPEVPDLFLVKCQSRNRFVSPPLLHRILLRFPSPSTRGYLIEDRMRPESWRKIDGRWICTWFVLVVHNIDESMFLFNEIPNSLSMRRFLLYRHMIYQTDDIPRRAFLETFEIKNEAFDLYHYLEYRIEGSQVTQISRF